MLLSDITPMILTFNEEANLQRTLSALKWADQILLVDSYSQDGTLEIARQFPQVRVVQRKFDHFADQCDFGLTHITTPWTLSLDADYVCPAELAEELQSLSGQSSGYKASFRYCVMGYPLRATLYPARTVLYRTELGGYARDGHAHRVHVSGEIGQLRTRLDHDDRKSLSVWLRSQAGYASLEADKLLARFEAQSKHDLSADATTAAEGSRQSLGWKDRLRKSTLLAPVLTLFYCLFWKGLLLDGRPGMLYTLQRVYAELLLAIELADRRLRTSREFENR